MMPVTRENLKSDMLKTVVIRFDYTGMTNFRMFVEKLKRKEWMQEAFDGLRIIRPIRQNIIVPTKTATLPVGDRVRNVTYHFEKCSLEPYSDAVFDVSEDCLCLTVNCSEHYSGSKSYTVFMTKVLSLLRQTDKYVSLERVGIRKIDFIGLKNLEQIFSFFNERFVVAQNWNNWKRETTQTELLQIDDFYFNVVQHIRKMADDDFRIVLDIDAYAGDELLQILGRQPSETFEVLDQNMQNIMFSLYVNVLAESYIDSHLRHE